MIRLTQTASLQQKMAPQLIQSLRLLQMPTLELEQLIQQELEINPLLELNEEQEQDQEEAEPEVEPEAESAEAEASAEEEKPEEAAAEDEKLEELEFDDNSDLTDDKFDEEDWNEYLNDSGYVSTREEFDPNVEEWENQGASQVSLQSVLKEQLLLTELAADERQIGEYIIGNIDEDGFLNTPVEDISDVLDVDVDVVEKVLAVIHTFEPSGVGARDLRECLLIQLKEQGYDGDLSMIIVRDHLDDWINRRYSRVCRALGIDKEELAEVQEIIAGLDPKPGFTPEPRVNFNLVIPDLEVTKIASRKTGRLAAGQRQRCRTGEADALQPGSQGPPLNRAIAAG